MVRFFRSISIVSLLSLYQLLGKNKLAKIVTETTVYPNILYHEEIHSATMKHDRLFSLSRGKYAKNRATKFLKYAAQNGTTERYKVRMKLKERMEN